MTVSSMARLELAKKGAKQSVSAKVLDGLDDAFSQARYGRPSPCQLTAAVGVLHRDGSCKP